ncbi:MAG: imidazoleglycerol-phosphate dehydratase HisB [Victivallaceae bacterium]
MRLGEVVRNTRETQISVKLELDGRGECVADTPVPFMNHMLELFARHGFFDLEIHARGDVEIDYHHTMEDLGLAFGEALLAALGAKKGIRRYGSCLLPMDEALAQVALDLSGRPCLVYRVEPPAPLVKDLDARLFHEFFQALSARSGMNLHIDLLKGEEVHHCFEAIFKAFAKALDQAVTVDPRIEGVLSTKGVL